MVGVEESLRQEYEEKVVWKDQGSSDWEAVQAVLAVGAWRGEWTLNIFQSDLTVPAQPSPRGPPEVAPKSADCGVCGCLYSYSEGRYL